VTERRPFYSEYFSKVRDRLSAGEREYGNKSLRERPLLEVLDELRQELEDIGGWSAIVHYRISQLMKELESDR
tara:strand:- start:4999 stop:5217 length:219 start_codon:yes stop_codon:yes gene_type:complete